MQYQKRKRDKKAHQNIRITAFETGDANRLALYLLMRSSRGWIDFTTWSSVIIVKVVGICLSNIHTPMCCNEIEHKSDDVTWRFNDHVVKYKMLSDLFPVNRLRYFSFVSWHYLLGVSLKNNTLSKTLVGRSIWLVLVIKFTIKTLHLRKRRFLFLQLFKILV